jgi:hypothetical protein
MRLDPIQTSVLRSNVNTLVGLGLIAACALWAGSVIVQAAWHVDPVANAFSAMVNQETHL